MRSDRNLKSGEAQIVSSQSRIGIIGAGTSGAYLAILLIQQGFQVDLFEKAPHPRTDGWGIPIVQAGMTSGWEDGLSLSRHLTSTANMAEALANFQAERLPIVHEYQRTSREISQQIRANASKS
ncbi:NAD(P)-binding protein [Microcoleus sp. ARI1-B5]|uniref:FAD-dependent oxidoreductase n=1 Tax=unclassified Microcoleus TaxID=2642155 RepID=UPI002FD2A963